MIEPYLLRAFLAAIALAVIAAPLGCFVVWNRMSYFGETIAQASLLGVALGLLFQVDVTLSVVTATVGAALAMIALTRQKLVPIDSVLGLMHHGALALGVITIASLKGQSVDLMGYLFGDIFAVSSDDLWWIAAIGIGVASTLFWLWQPLIRMSVHDDLARAEGLSSTTARTLFTLLLAVVIAVAIKIVGILLAIAFLIVPVVSARPFVRNPESMVLVSAVVGVVCVVAGLLISTRADVPGGPAIVLVMTLVAAASLLFAGWQTKA
ncbi:MAG: metal ABC transporter permease [Alphaproteobacteria bacterium]|nr:metal ABC transporter permease [Alphaproteobacteria bacterium]